MTEPNEHAVVDNKPDARLYWAGDQVWYVEVVLKHPTDSTQPPQSRTFEVGTKWWAEFFSAVINDMTLEQYTDFLRDGHTF